MNDFTMVETTPRLALMAETAADLMSDHPVSVNADACLREALSFLIENGFGAAPVIDRAGRLVGVLSRSDLLAHDLETFEHIPERAEFYSRRDLQEPDGEPLGDGFQVEKVDVTRVGDVMTPAVYCVAPGDPAAKVVRDIVYRNIHRVFVVDEHNVLVGVISTMDVLRHLRPTPAPGPVEVLDELGGHGCMHYGR